MRSFWTRRRFVGAAARVSTLFVAASWGSGCSRDATTSAPPLPQETAAPDRDALQRIAYLLFPFPEVGAEPYARVAATIAAAVEADPGVAELVSGGLARLDSPHTRPWRDLDESEQLRSLESIEGEPFFAYMLNTTKSQLFNDRVIWAHIGFDPNAPLNDIDWLGDS